ncbi:hypothetical protein K493DRAFT_362527 [Basidiobolus meristosporus CBS 931.73]|uniref:NAD(+) diphosphatase n=1 Tax=Basidiobolus meristosporus CBS 931.73 TaxID=1314790 RepID=A0A1Y1X1G2_9FUNG|nr:hypothetical protein K493DRAFT_362527 [Basidiobolus meristosporus CBS 931.73]|eukprot:ORX79647.1 hypothetical protein K493DRAFT_362527 [Basidiobolus meristosporus CBS 931.73]
MDPAREKVHFPEAAPNFFAGSNLNRISERRTDIPFLSEALTSPNSLTLLLSNGNPLASTQPTALHWLPYTDIKELVGNPFADSENQRYPEGVTLVFLGIDKPLDKSPNYYWTLDVSAKGPLERSFVELQERFTDSVYSFIAMRPTCFGLSPVEAAILAQARALVDWNARNQYCPACGNKTILVDAGYKRTCPPISPDQVSAEHPPCISTKGVHNFAYPRTDPVVIVCTVSPQGDRILLGRQKSWPPGMYSCVSGFVEPGESLEEAARREVREETGIVLGPVTYHSSQPWPFPNCLMIGCIGKALSEDINLEDMELDEARWFSREEVIGGLENPVDLSMKDSQPTTDLRLPPENAIAHHIIKAWALD